MIPDALLGSAHNMQVHNNYLPRYAGHVGALGTSIYVVNTGNPFYAQDTIQIGIDVRWSYN